MASSRILSMFSRPIRPRQFIREFSYYSFLIISWVPAAVFFNEHVGQLSWIHGPSMYPYLNADFNQGLTEDMCWVNKWGPTENLQRGMIVAFRSPAHPEIVSVKRVIAVEGDQVITRSPYPYPIADVPAGHVWVEGDIRDSNKTLDSNYYGPISISLVTGKVTHVLLPWKSCGPIRWWEFRGKTKVIRGRRENAHQWD